MAAVPKGVKSRSGCVTCKRRRVKCDETKPLCRQCVSKNLECPGYDIRWRWSTKHERSTNFDLQRSPTSRRKIADSLHSPLKPPAGIICHSRQQGNEGTAAHVDQFKSASPTIDPDLGSRYGSDRFGCNTDHALLSDVWDVVERPASRSRRRRSVSVSKSSLPEQLTLVTRKHIWPPPDTILGGPQTQVDFFAQRICKALTVFDSKINPFRLVSISRTKESLLFFSLVRYVTAAFLTSSGMDTSSALVVQDAQTDILHRLHNEVARLHTSMGANPVDVLTAIIMYGLSINWDGSDSPSIFHYNAAVQLYLQTYRHDTLEPRVEDHHAFLLHSLAYWRMGLAFVTDTTKETLLASPVLEPGNEDDTYSKIPAKRYPHILAGVSPEAQKLLGQVGSLIYSQRVRSREMSFTSMARLQNDLEAVQKAQALEQDALSLALPEVGEFADTEDPDTPIQDLINTAEVYRLSALVLLYRAFPDLLNVRLGARGDGFDACHSTTTTNRRLLWVTSLSLHALDILSRNGQRSGTRSVEQILLVILAGELRRDTCVNGSRITEERLSLVDSGSPTADADDSTLSPTTSSAFDHFEGVHGLTKPRHSPEDVTPSSSITQARATVLKRLRAIREILPYKSIELVEELVLKTWQISDDENREVFWMDVMIDNGWKFLMV
ncbi:uncharacterized protein PV06_07880 [Exophiala oligosperma]|uniref:Zn(2)-C6 fungal-type domain-containing protein n=1 Tax=Exophiala oligosperma TaxID=215243 RepID=A0A0D2DC70_9EURO|nr:uncharacterized protein PV06_07880 [Exophiala oligosperma]KIW40703.1 hypothetical protein PV06_07880 [Exophiala oligosperma]